MPRTTFHNYVLEFEENDRHGYDYLASKLNSEEAKVYFDYAKSHGEAQFETQSGKDYSLFHKDGLYTLVKREE
ncbi:MAG: hypothetical protein PHQ47_02130 [Candidatus Portnoybacteria bacterium]|nr:hypothetical protein [Candidatus Portnoybacteria bacterium]